MRARPRLLLLAALAALPARALGPHEVLLLVNRRSPASLEVATHYARLRDIPPVNIVLLDVPEGALGEAAELSLDEFRATILEPAEAEMRKRGLADHILAWAYAPDFPVRLTTQPEVSLAGATLVRGRLPGAEEVRKGDFRSPLYAGPDRAAGPFASSHSLEFHAAQLQGRMPLPSMMLGVAGARGLTAAQITDQLKATRAADASGLAAPVWLVTNDDVRAQTRAWQFPAAARELADLGVRAELTGAPPQDQPALGGLMLGQADIEPARYGRLAAGALADHLTSFGAVFSHPHQSKLTAWLAHGAAAAAGTVAEPYSIWTKFPQARLFAHAARGCTALESYYQSVRCPLQLLIVGDPLSAPRAQPAPVTLALLQDDPAQGVTGVLEFVAAPLAGAEAVPVDYLYLLDGRTLDGAKGPRGTLDTRRLPDGWHDLRVVAYRAGDVRHQSFAQRGFQIRNHGRQTGARVVGDARAADLDHALPVEITPAEGSVEVAVIAQERIVARSATNGPAVLLVNPRLLGAGPHRLQAVSVYRDRMAVRSAPIDVTFRALNRAPRLETFTWQPGAAGRGVLGVQAGDAENDVTLAAWGEWLGAAGDAARARFQVAGAGVQAEWQGERLTMRTEADLEVCRVAGLSLTNARRWAVRLRVPAGHGCGGLAFNIRNPANFEGFGWFGEPCGWAFFRTVDGVTRRLVTRGSPVRAGAWVEIAINRTAAGGLEAEVDGQALCGWPEARWTDGAAGLFAGRGESAFERVAVVPPERSDVRMTERGLDVAEAGDLTGLFLRLSDGRAASEEPARRPAQ